MPLTRQQTVTAALSLSAIWLLTHRYHGIHHDALFYAVQALAHAAPARFEHDLFFAFGSQDDYTLFTPAYAWLGRQAGLGNAAFVLLVAAQCLWAFAAIRIARQWLQGLFLVAGLALLFALPGQYGHDPVFRYAESFLTARVWAECLVLNGLAATLAGRSGLAAAAVLGASLLHPIMALPGLLFLAFYHGYRHWKWLLLLLPVLALGAASVMPRMDTAWLELVRRRAPFVLIDQWQWQEWLEPFTWIGILLAAARGIAPARKAFAALALTGTAGIALAVIAALTQATLLVQAQPWRCLWLLKVGGILALAALFMHRWRRSPADNWLLAGFAAAALTAGSLGGPTALVLALLANTLWQRETPPELPRWMAPGAAVALFAVLLETLLALLQQGSYVIERIQSAISPGNHWPAGDLASPLHGPLALLLPPLAVALVMVAKRHPASTVGAALIFLSAASYGWYRADDPLQNLLFRATNQRPFDREIPPDATVYWQDNFLYAWFLLGQGNYASTQQSVGVVFSGQTAQETRRRLARISAFSPTDSDIGPDGALLPVNRQRPDHAPQVADLATLCQDPILHSVILRQPLGAPPHTTWVDPLGNATW
jgi:hypothetical protein